MSSTNRSNTENETPGDSSRPDQIHSTGYSSDDAIISRALKILEYRAKYSDNLSVSSPDAARDFCRLKLGGLPHEVFGVLWLDAQNRLIAFEEMFRGTLTQTSVYPREVVKTALARNAAAVILTHNHPSGVAEPSMADQALTQALKQALALVDVKVLDHLVVSASGVSSFAERGLI
jgi:DNA repair protein RadC